MLRVDLRDKSAQHYSKNVLEQAISNVNIALMALMCSYNKS